MDKQQEKRGPGRPRRGKGTRHIDLTLSLEVIEALEQEAKSGNMSRFVDDWLRQHPGIKARLWEEPEFQGEREKNNAGNEHR